MVDGTDAVVGVAAAAGSRMKNVVVVVGGMGLLFLVGYWRIVGGSVLVVDVGERLERNIVWAVRMRVKVKVRSWCGRRTRRREV